MVQGLRTDKLETVIPRDIGGRVQVEDKLETVIPRDIGGRVQVETWP